MSMGLMPLIAIALLPAIVLCVYVFRKDRLEKEPIGLLLKLLFFGALSCIPAIFAELAVQGVIQSFFSPAVMADIESGIARGTNEFYTYSFFEYFIGVALVEELVKFLFLIWITKKNREYNCVFDGLIYAVFVSLGFAAFENVFYVLENGITVGIMRAFLSVPGHMFFGVMMGYYYSLWHVTDKAAFIERGLIQRGIVTPRSGIFDSGKHKTMCLLVPVLAHGLYDFCCVIGTGWSIILLLAFVIFMYVRCFKTIRNMSAGDTYEETLAVSMVMQKYPGITPDEF